MDKSTYLLPEGEEPADGLDILIAPGLTQATSVPLPIKDGRELGDWAFTPPLDVRDLDSLVLSFEGGLTLDSNGKPSNGSVAPSLFDAARLYNFSYESDGSFTANKISCSDQDKIARGVVPENIFVRIPSNLPKNHDIQT